MKKILPLLLIVMSIHVLGQVPGTISYQGILTDGFGNPVPDGDHNVVFKFYADATGGTPLVLAGQPLEYGPFIIQTFKGLFSFVIGGGGSSNPPLPPDFGNQEVWLGISPDNQAEMSPRIRLTSVPYSFRANVADQVGSIDASKLTSGTIDNTRLDPDLQDLADGTLSGSKVGDGIDAINITAGSLSDARLSADLQDLADGSLSGSKVGTGINASNITSGTLSDNRLESTVDINGLNVGSASQFSINAAGNVTKLNNINTSFPSTQGSAGSFLANDGTGALSWSTISAASITSGTLSDSRLSTHLQDLADGSLSGSKVGSGINAANVSSGALSDLRLSTHLQDLADGMLSGTKVDLVAGTNITLTPTGSSVTIASDAPGGSGVVNEIPFWNTANQLGSSNGLYWDNADNQLGIGVGSPNQKLDIAVQSGEASTTGIVIQNNSDNAVGNKTGIVIDLNDRGPSPRFGIMSTVNRGGGNNNPQTGIQSLVISVQSNGPSTGISSIINNGGSGESYSFFGNSSGAGTGVKYGIFTMGESFNKLDGNLLVGAGSTSTYKLQVNGNTFLNGLVDYAAPSDRRVKKDILDFGDGLAAVMKMRPVTFKYNGLGGTSDDGRQHIGFIAQEIKKLAPYMVKSDMRNLYPQDVAETEILTYNDTALPYILVNAVQEQQRQIDGLIDEITRLKGLVTELSKVQGSTSGRVTTSKRK